ncbi:hypothetical protein [Mycobacterium sp. AZCC_0083]|uniref:hypothetical protein n=1 Tax=Mycobacterium sp. AZCC_0083 TaxID=2735882 RepID=UPI001836262F|nr:hypothetical protein [Mycobacterium sp. AZCC_0083]MBB5167510.1 drug/metabolite transporter (DMT)-like permease [Mycobacterium sp. AZCC_0083]
MSTNPRAHLGVGPTAIAILLSWMFLGEVPTLLGFVGGALALGGVAISRRRSLRRRDRRIEDIQHSVPGPSA